MSRMFPRRNRWIWAITFALLVFLSVPSGTEAVLYQWRDASGAIHFTNDPGNIPEPYRKSAQEFDNGPPPSAHSPQPDPKIPANSNATVVAPLTVLSNQFYAKVRLNGKIEANMLLDTGASVVVISGEIAKKLGFHSFEAMPQVEVETAGGKIWTPIAVLERIELAGAEAVEVEAVINPMLSEKDGLLGMGFLNQFRTEMDYAGASMTLKPIAREGEKIYGNQPEGWWKERLESYYSAMLQFRAQADELKRKGNPKAHSLDLAVGFYRDHYRKLKDRAMREGLPFNYPKEP